MGLFKMFCMGLLVVVARTQKFQDCSVDTSPLVIGSTEDAVALATSLQCSNGDFAVEWVGEVLVEETIRVTGGTSLNITGTGSGAIADGGGNTQLFYVNEGSRMHLSHMVLTQGNASDGWAIDASESSVLFSANRGGAVFANQSVVSLGRNMSVISNSAGLQGGAVYALESSLSWVGDGAEFSSNHAGEDGGAIYAFDSTVSWVGDGTQFSSNHADFGGAIFASESTVSWHGDGTQLSSNHADFGGVIFASESIVSWHGDSTQLSSNSADFGGAIFALNGSTVSWDGDGTQFSSNSAKLSAGAIYAESDSTVFWSGSGTLFSSNSAGSGGGAILALNGSTVSWDGDGTQFSSNSAEYAGGAIAAQGDSTVSWGGDRTRFNSNSAGVNGGAILAFKESTVSWYGDGTQFSNNTGGTNGGGIYVQSDSTVSWDGDGTQFGSNSATYGGGAVYAYINSTVSWGGDRTLFSSNSADSGGAMLALNGSTASWDGDDTRFSSNYANTSGGAIYAGESSTVSWYGDGTQFGSNSAGDGGGAIMAVQLMTIFWTGSTTFQRNVAGGFGGALYLAELGPEVNYFIGATFIENSAQTGGAVTVVNGGNGCNFLNATFQLNSASGTGGAFTAFSAILDQPIGFLWCNFSDNVAGETGGAVEILSGPHFFRACHFEGNSADIGGALRIGSASVEGCSFVSNFAYTRGLAIAAVGSGGMSDLLFVGNQLSCAVGSYRRESEQQEDPNARFKSVCTDCPDWDECSNCTIERENVTPTCETPLAHTTADENGVTLETLNITQGYWRATNQSVVILACYNADACIGGETGLESFCASGYKGPYCAVCETGYAPTLAHTCTRCSSPRRKGLMAATVIVGVAAILAVAMVFKYLLSTKLDEGNTGCFRRRIQAVPVQALKIIVVVWQILTQFADAADTTYPGLYQDFLSFMDVVVNFDLGSVLAAGCLWTGINFHHQLLFSTIGPLVVVTFLAMTHWFAVWRNGASGDVAVLAHIRHKHQTALLLLTFLIYSSVSSKVFQTFACETLDDGMEYLRADYRIGCDDSVHKAFEAYAIVMVIVYPVGIPLLYTCLLFHRRDVLAKADADRTVAQSIAALWEAYRPVRFYYEVIECGRRVMLTGVVVFIFPNDAAQIAITMLVEFFFFTVFEVLAPYESESDMWLSRGGHVIVFLSMFDLLLLKVDVSGERDQSQATFAGVLLAGHVLMIVFILVEAIGICYTSGRRQALWRPFTRQRSVSEEPYPTPRASLGP